MLSSQSAAIKQQRKKFTNSSRTDDKEIISSYRYGHTTCDWSLRVDVGVVVGDGNSLRLSDMCFKVLVSWLLIGA